MNIKFLFWMKLLSVWSKIFLLLLLGCGPSIESHGTGEMVIKWTRMAFNKIDTLRARGSFLYTAEDKKFRSDAYIFYNKPDSLRVDLMGPIDATTAVIVFKGKKNFFIDYLNSKVFISEGGGCLMSEILGSKTVIEDLPRIFLGEPPIIKFEASRTKESPKGYYIAYLYGKDSQVVEKLQIADGFYGAVVLRGAVIANDNKVIDFSFRQRGWYGRDTAVIPRIIEVGIVPEQIAVVLKYIDVEVNEDLKDEVFNISIPEGFSIEEVSCN